MVKNENRTWEKVAEMLEVEYNTPFCLDINGQQVTAVFSNRGFIVFDPIELSDIQIFSMLMCGKAKVVKGKIFPSVGDEYFTVYDMVNDVPQIERRIWDNSLRDHAAYSIGNVFKSIDEAEKNIDNITSVLLENYIYRKPFVSFTSKVFQE